MSRSKSSKKSTPQKFKKVGYSREAVIAFCKARHPEIDWSFLEDELPKIVWRNRWNEFADKCGLPNRRGYIENLDSLGKGPASF